MPTDECKTFGRSSSQFHQQLGAKSNKLPPQWEDMGRGTSSKNRERGRGADNTHKLQLILQLRWLAGCLLGISSHTRKLAVCPPGTWKLDIRIDMWTHGRTEGRKGPRDRRTSEHTHTRVQSSDSPKPKRVAAKYLSFLRATQKVSAPRSESAERTRPFWGSAK